MTPRWSVGTMQNKGSQTGEAVKVLSKTAKIDKNQQKNRCNLLIFSCQHSKFTPNLEYFHSLWSLGTSAKPRSSLKYLSSIPLSILGL